MALMCLNLYGVRLSDVSSKKGVKSQHIDAFCINLSYLPKDQSLIFFRWRIGGVENFELAILIFQRIFFASFLLKSVTIHGIPRMGRISIKKLGSYEIMRNNLIFSANNFEKQGFSFSIMHFLNIQLVIPLRSNQPQKLLTAY